MDTKSLKRLSDAVSGHGPEPDQYLTDGRKLDRVVVLRSFNDEELVEIEDCASLDVWLVSPEELGSLRRVRRTRAREAGVVGMVSPLLGDG